MPRCWYILKSLFCFSDDKVYYQGHRRDGASEDVPESKERVTFALTIMDRGEGSDICLMCCKMNEMEVGENEVNHTLFSF